MSNNHSGNILNEITREEHDGQNNAKRVTLVGNVSITAVSQVTVTPQQAWPDPKTFIGLVTVVGSLSPAAGNVTLDPGSRTGIIGNVTLSDSKGFIGLVTAVGSFSTTFTGNVTLDPGSRTGIVGNVTLSDSKGFIGLVSIGGGILNTVAAVTDITNPVALKGNVTISDSKGFIGLVTVVQASTTRSIVGNLTLSDSKTFIGLATTVPAYGSAATVFTGIISSTGNTTITTPPNNTRFFIKNMLISSLGRSEIEVRSGATTLIPFTSLSTTGGYVGPFGEMGVPARSQNDALVIGLNGGSTISYMFNVRFEP